MDSSPLLDLPRELRQQILRHLLVSPRVIVRTHRKNNRLHPGILRANKQLYAEGLHVLYGKNYFFMQLYCYGEYGVACFDRNEAYLELLEYGGKPDIRMLQNLEFRVSLKRGDEEETSVVKGVVRRAATLLSNAPLIRHLRIALYCSDHYYVFGPNDEDDHIPDSDDQTPHPVADKLYDQAHVLQPFALLRNVGRVDVRGRVRPRYRQYLKTVMEGGNLVDDLHKKYDALVRFADPLALYEKDLGDACVAMQYNKAEDFERIRTDLIPKAMQRYKAAIDGFDDLNSLYDHDLGGATQVAPQE